MQKNKELVDRKIRQGFTQLQLTPIAMPVLQLVDCVTTALLQHAATETIFQTKRYTKDTNIPVRVNKGPIWIWERVRQATGWTVEDFLTHFIIRLETANQVSHDRRDGNALWLLGSYMPNLMPNAKLVPVGFWDRDVGWQLRLSTHRSANRFKDWGARTMVRLGNRFIG